MIALQSLYISLEVCTFITSRIWINKEFVAMPGDFVMFQNLIGVLCNFINIICYKILKLITRNRNFNQYRQVIRVEKGKCEKESVNWKELTFIFLLWFSTKPLTRLWLTFIGIAIWTTIRVSIKLPICFFVLGEMYNTKHWYCNFLTVILIYKI